MTEKIEAVDTAELEALERRAREHDGNEWVDRSPSVGVPPRPVVEQRAEVEQRDEATIAAIEAVQVPPVPGTGPTLTPIWKVGADGKLEPLVEASAVDARLAALEAELTHLRLMTRHTMLLVMVMADRLKVSTGEYDQARALADKVDAEAK